MALAGSSRMSEPAGDFPAVARFDQLYAKALADARETLTVTYEQLLS